MLCIISYKNIFSQISYKILSVFLLVDYALAIDYKRLGTFPWKNEKTLHANKLYNRLT